MQNDNPYVLEHTVDSHNSVKIYARDIPSDENSFAQALAPTMVCLQSKGVRNVLIFLYMKHTDYIKHTVPYGFKFHHTEKDQVALSKWLPDTTDKFPPYASHYAGVGGVVINPVNEEILVIQEKSSARDAGVWKVPGGLVDAGEFVGEAAEREVLEETEIRSKFLGVIGFRQTRRYLFDCSDIYFIALLRPESVSQKIGGGDGEVAKCCWMPLQEYLNIEWKHPTQTHVRDAVEKI
jgi:8-oxo-dGTP pyrophosphatase MutT (NUDIX family)